MDLVLRETDLPLRSLPAASPWTLEQALEQALDPAMICDSRGDWDDALA